MNPSAKLSELIDALEFESEESVTRFDRRPDALSAMDRHILSAFEEGDEDELGELPDWQKEQLEIARAVAGRRRRAVHCRAGQVRLPRIPPHGTVHRHSGEHAGRGGICGGPSKAKAPFRFFKDTANRLGLLDQWYRVSRRGREGACHGLGRGQPSDELKDDTEKS